MFAYRIFILVMLVGMMRAVPYSMYVWREGWDPTAGCSEQQFLDWSDTECTSHTWDTPARRQWLWDTCNVNGREVDTIFLYDVQLLAGPRDCGDVGVTWLRDTLNEGRTQVPGLKVYALFSDGGEEVPEKDHIEDVVWYNENCAADVTEIFDGVAINNEDYQRTWPESRMVTYLDNLHQVKLNVDQQLPAGSLKAHYSISWIWGYDDQDAIIEVTWNGNRKPIVQHFIDIFDSIDVQVAFVTSAAMEERMIGSEWDYAQLTGKELHTNVYINWATPCQVTFFPFPTDHPVCVSWSHPYKTETAMFTELDELETLLPGAKPCLHHFRGAYSSGGYPGWPVH